MVGVFSSGESAAWSGRADNVSKAGRRTQMELHWPASSWDSQLSRLPSPSRKSGAHLITGFLAAHSG